MQRRAEQIHVGELAMAADELRREERRVGQRDGVGPHTMMFVAAQSLEVSNHVGWAH